MMLSKPRPRRATVSVPGDKSITHRALMLAAIADGRTLIVHPNLGLDVDATVSALRQVGVRIRTTDNGYEVQGRQQLRNPRHVIDCGNSGTTMRLLMGLLAGRLDAVLDGDASLRRRPMARLAIPLNAMGAEVGSARGGLPPVRLHRRKEALVGIRYTLAVASAQVKSALILAALRAKGKSIISSPQITRDHTERMLRAMRARLTVRGKSIHVYPSHLIAAGRVRIPGDLSAAVYLLCAAAVLPGSQLRLRRVGINPTRSAALDVLRKMHARVAISNRKTWLGEPVGDLSIAGGAQLRGTTVAAQVVPILIDEIPALCALAASAKGVFRVRGASELKVKESNRIRTTVALLRSFGAQAHELSDGVVVHGGRPLRAPRSVNTQGDHRVGMAAAILAAAAQAPVRIEDSECIATSFPGFASTWRSAFSV